jgi:RNA polymerase sigma-70 factor (ECF subfamily)
MTVALDAATSAPSWAELASRLRPFIRRRVAGDADADDVLQEVLLRMHRGLPGLEDDRRFGAWMYRVARTSIADHLRTRARHPLARDAEMPEEVVDPFEDEEAEAEAVVASVISVFVAMLPSPYREALILTELEGRTQLEAAEMLGISLTAMKSRVRRGRAKLRASLEACCRIAVDARGRIIECTPREGGAAPPVCCD